MVRSISAILEELPDSGSNVTVTKKCVEADALANADLEHNVLVVKYDLHFMATYKTSNDTIYLKKFDNDQKSVECNLTDGKITCGYHVIFSSQ